MIKCDICHRETRGHIAPSETGEVVCLGCVAAIANQLEGGRPEGFCVCGALVSYETESYTMFIACPRCNETKPYEWGEE